MLPPLGRIYGNMIDLRNSLYDRGILRSYPLGARTISIGNITAGGTGKTPLVALVADTLAESGERVCILTRGYGRKNPRQRVLVCDREQILVDAAAGGDEPVELAHRLLGRAVIISDADRVGAAQWAKDRFGITVFVLDDGFQHRRAERDLDVVCIDATDPFGNGRVLPAGKLREPLHNLRRSDAFVITRADLVVSTEPVVRELLRINPRCPVFLAKSKIASVISLGRFMASDRQGSEIDPDFRTEVGVLAFCAIGNPQSFFDGLRARSFDVAATRTFRDHHRYSHADVDQIQAQAEKANVSVLLTTAKDAVKLNGLEFSMPCFVVLSSMEIADEGFGKLISQAA